jgi:MYND finger
MCIFYPSNKMFMDMNRGVRQEHSTTSMVFPASLKQLTRDCESLHHSLDDSSRRCFQCGKQPAGEQLKRCGRCKLSFYCSKECHAAHWKDTHKRLCRYTGMLRHLVAMDFSTFEDFVDWGFAPTVQQTPDERQETRRQAMHDFLRSHGTEPYSKKERLVEFLQYCRDKVLDNDSIWTRISSTLYKQGRHRLSPHSLSSHPVFQGLDELAKKYQCHPSQRHHVIDMRSADDLDAIIMDYYLTAFLCSLPQWQVESKIMGIVWILEIRDFINQGRLFPSGAWNVLIAPDDQGFVARRIHCNDQAHFHENLCLLSKLSLVIADKFPDVLVVRVFRPVADSTNSHYVREIATQETVDNLVTLWIREDMALHGGRFRPPNPDLTLVEQLMDFEESLSDVFGRLWLSQMAAEEGNE